MNHNLLLEISLNNAKSSSCVAIDSARLRPEQEAWHHPRWFGTQSCRVIICLCSITLDFCKPPPQSSFGDRRWVVDSCFNPRDFDEPRWQSISTANLTLGLTRQFRAFSAHQFPLFPPFLFRCAYILLSLVYIKTKTLSWRSEKPTKTRSY